MATKKLASEKVLENIWNKEAIYYTGGWCGGLALFSLIAVFMCLAYHKGILKVL